MVRGVSESWAKAGRDAPRPTTRCFLRALSSAFAAAQVGLDLASAVEYIHGQGIVHRHLKLQKAMLRKENGSTVIMKLGIVRQPGERPRERLTQAGGPLGTLRSTAPEEAAGSCPALPAGATLPGRAP